MTGQQQQRSANAVSGKTARACDSCLRRRARWYCAADDAFLCQPCDSSVHSANPLARRHDRVRLKTSSSSLPSLTPSVDLHSALPSWNQGFKRKARTPRHAKGSTAVLKPVLLVPDLENDDDTNSCTELQEEEEQLLYCVPIFDPVLAEFSSPPTSTTPEFETKPETIINQLLLPASENQGHGLLPEFNPSDAELAEFAADVENLLGQGLDDDSFCIDTLGLLDVEDKRQVKMELMDVIDTLNGSENDVNANFLVDMEMEFSRESLEFNFDCESPIAGEEVEEHKAEIMVEEIHSGPTMMKVGLRLDYEAVIAAWSSCEGRLPWTTGERPPSNLDDSWPDLMGTTWGTTVGGELQGGYGDMRKGGHIGNGDGGREARVSRYREKRRTRLFSKKIRYEVRKLNAEKRPRMKGRFVKRTSFPALTCGGGSAVTAGFTNYC